MKVFFSFIEEDITFTIEMEIIPRIGELISIEQITKDDFLSESDYNNYKEEEVEFRQWRVDDIAWSPIADGKTNVTIYLTEDIKRPDIQAIQAS
jgi:trans-2-enoyl-CoA reductase